MSFKEGQEIDCPAYTVIEENLSTNLCPLLHRYYLLCSAPIILHGNQDFGENLERLLGLHRWTSVQEGAVRFQVIICFILVDL
jgi:hypothetical protein